MNLNNKNIPIKTSILAALFAVVLAACTKYQDGFLSPYFQYPLAEYTIPKGRIFTSDAINPDGSSIPFKVKLRHVYNEAGQIVDEQLLKQYPVSVWSAAYNNAKDTTAALVAAKRKEEQLPAIRINENNGAIEANPATLNLPAGRYTLDLEISNKAGVQVLEKIVTIILKESPAFEATPELGTALDVAIKNGNETQSIAQSNPTVTAARVADAPNVVVVKFVDKNGVPFDHTALQRRPNPGLNPVPLLRPVMGDYLATTTVTETAIEYHYTLTPFPLAASNFGYGFRYYYRIPYDKIKIDNAPDDYSANPSFVFRVWTPGKYEVTIKMSNAVKE